MSSVFRKSQEYNNTPNRNSFDRSFQNNITMEFGKIYPVFFEKLMPGASISVKPTFSLHFMPMVFPVQTRMRAHLHFFKVRLRNLWKDFPDFYGNTKQGLEPPYIRFTNQNMLDTMASTGSLGDYLNLPTRAYGRFGTTEKVVGDYNPDYSVKVPKLMKFVTSGSAVELPTSSSDWSAWSAFRTFYTESGPIPATEETRNGKWFAVDYSLKDVSAGLDTTGNLKFRVPISSNAPSTLLQWQSAVLLFHTSDDRVSGSVGGYIAVANNTTSVFGTASAAYPSSYIEFTYSPDFDLSAIDKVTVAFLYSSASSTSVGLMAPVSSSEIPLSYLSSPADVSSSLTSTDPQFSNCPWFGTTKGTVKLSALPFRCYESVYNAWYRNIQNNPYMLNGQPEYNQYIPTVEGGADTNIYQLRYRNWEDDFLTTALPNPQQGNNPVLVGITTLSDGASTLALLDENGKQFSIKPVLSEDGNGIDSIEYEEDASGNGFRQVSTFSDLATTGISIPDLRNANALQRWLELNARKGLRFKDVVKGHFDVDIRFDELQMPEFLGGITRDVTMNQINQYSTVAPGSSSFEDVLGSFAGQAGCFGNSEHAIRTFVDEPCFVIGLLSVVPVANYSQLLPKYFTDRDVLDEYFPEFANISYQPIKLSEVCPLQAFADDPASLDDTFGYQRAWYQHLARVDEVHGLFRTSLRNFLINRVFDTAPQLSESFLLVDPEQINDVFAVTDVTDKIVGQVYFDCVAKLPIPRVGIPRLE